MRISDSLRRVRENGRFSLRETAARAGIAASNLSVIENGRRDPTTSTAGRIAQALGVSFLTVPLKGRPTAADSSAAIAAADARGDRAGAYRAYLQLAADLEAASPFDRVLLAAEEPAIQSARWADAVAGLVEWRLGEVGAPLPEWVVGNEGSAGDPWQPQRVPFALSITVDLERVPEPLARRGVLVEEGELQSV